MIVRIRIILLSLVLVFVGYLFCPGLVNAGSAAGQQRALLIGNADYWDDPKPLVGVTGDLQRMQSVLASSLLLPGIPQYSSIKLLNNATGREMLAGIREAFDGASDSDVSLLYFSGHGTLDNYGKAYLCGVDSASPWFGFVGVNELEQVLRHIPGTKVIVLDCCYSGGFMYPSLRRGDSDNTKAGGEPTVQFNKAVLAAFGFGVKSFLNSSEYKILTSCAPDEYSYVAYDGELLDYGGVFTNNFVKGVGFIDGDYRADFNADNVVTLDEMYRFTHRNVTTSSVQVYPHGDPFVLVGKGDTRGYNEFPLNPAVATNVELNRGWKIRFNKALNVDTVNEENIFISDSIGAVMQATVRMDDERTVHLIPREPYKAGGIYNIYITPRVTAADSSRLQAGVLVTFHTCAVGVKAPQGLLVKDTRGQCNCVLFGYW